MNEFLKVSLLSLFCSFPVFGGLLAGDGSARAGYSYVGGIGGIGESGEEKTEGNLGTGLEEDLNFSDAQGRSFYAIKIKVDTGNQRRLEFVDEELQAISGEGRVGGNVDEVAGQWRETDLEPTFTVTFARSDNQNLQEFEVTETALPFSLEMEFDGVDGQALVNLDRFENGGWRLQSLYSARNTVPGRSEEFTLQPGRYRMRATSNGAITQTKTGASNSYRYRLQRADIVTEVPLNFGEYTYPDIFTEFRDPETLSPTNIRILNELEGEGDDILFRVQADVRNTSFCPWRQVVWGVDSKQGLLSGVTVESQVMFDRVAANSTEEAEVNEILLLRSARASAPAVRMQIEDGSLFSLTGRELVVFNVPVTFFEPSDVANWREDSSSLEFGAEPTAEPGTLWMQNPASGPVFIAREGADGPERWTGPLESPTPDAPLLRLPFVVTATTEVPGDDGTTWQVEGRVVSLADHILHGTFTSGVEGIFGPDGQAVTDDLFADDPMFPLSRPIHFNRVKIRDRIFLSGAFTFLPENFEVSVRFSFNELTSAFVETGFKGSAHLLLEIEDNVDNSGDALIDTTRELLDILLFTVELPGGFRLEPRFVLEAGAIIDSPSGLTVPLNAQYDFSIRAGQMDGVPFSEVEGNAESLVTSIPEIFSGASATAEGWVQADLKVLLSYQGSFPTGPTFSSRATVNFSADQAATPWWETDGRLDLRIGNELATIGGAEASFDVENVVASFSLFDSAAAEAFQADAKPEGTVAPPGICTVSDPAAGFARLLLPETARGVFNPFATNLQGTRDFLAGNQGGSRSHYSRFNEFGGLVWTREINATIVDVVSEADGGALLLGLRSLKKIDANGDLVWDRIWDVSGVSNFEAVAAVADAGHVYVLGRAGDLENNRFVGALVKLDREGAVVWARTHAPLSHDGGMASFRTGDLVLTNDGNLAVCLTGTLNIDPSIGALPDFVREAELHNSSENGVISKVNSGTGETVWSTLIAHGGGVTYRAVTQDPAGNFYIGGRILGSVGGTLPANLIVKVDAAGNPVDGTLMGHFDQGANSSPLFGNLPKGGETAFDKLYDLVWAGDRLWVSGSIGIPSQGSVDICSAALDTSLNVTRYAMHAGPGDEYGYRILARETGPLIVGTSGSFLPWPRGVDEASGLNQDALFFLQLPWEGKMNFHAISAGAQPDNSMGVPRSGSWFIYPRQVSLVNRSGTSNASRFRKNYTIWANQAVEDEEGDLRVEVRDGSARSSEPGVSRFLALEYLPESLITDAGTYARWYQLDPNEDADGDGFDQASEYYYGMDPLDSDPSPIGFALLGSEDDAMVEMSFPRRAGLTTLPVIREGNLVDEWMNSPDAEFEVVPLGNGNRDEVKVRVPRTEAKRFYQLVAPGLDGP